MILKLPGHTGIAPGSFLWGEIANFCLLDPRKSVQRGADRDSVRISPGDIGTVGRRKRFCQDKPRGYRKGGA